MPLILIFSNDLGQLTNRFGVDPKVLPMIPIRLQDDQTCDQGKDVRGEEGHESLLRSMFVFEYRTEQGGWVDLNPVLAEAKEFQS